jgi:glc operon protein GlcG
MSDSTALTLSDARAMLDRAIAHADALGVTVSIAIVDGSGVSVASARMDGASFVSPEIALGKAWTAAAFKVPSGKVAENMASAPAFASGVSAATHGRFMPRQGAIALDGGGAIGASGATSAQDEEIARAGAGSPPE